MNKRCNGKNPDADPNKKEVKQGITECFKYSQSGTQPPYDLIRIHQARTKTSEISIERIIFTSCF